MLQQDEIIEMARQAGFHEHDFPFKKFKFEAFAKLVRDDYSFTHAQLWLNRIDEAVKAEREACAKVCESLPTVGELRQLERATMKDCAHAIRARGEQHE